MNGILFTPENRKLILQGLKTQTRRPMNPQPPEYVDKAELLKTGSWNFYKESDPDFHAHPKSGSRYSLNETVFIRELFYAYGYWDYFKNGRKFIRTRDDITFDRPPEIIRGMPIKEQGWYLRSPLFLEAKDARSFIQVKQVRAERLKDITFEDCLAEGIIHTDFWPIPGDSEAMKRFDEWADKQPCLDNELDEDKQNEAISQGWTEYTRQAYFSLWDSINFKKYPSKDNPWDWAYTLRLTPKPEEFYAE